MKMDVNPSTICVSDRIWIICFCRAENFKKSSQIFNTRTSGDEVSRIKVETRRRWVSMWSWDRGSLPFRIDPSKSSLPHNIKFCEPWHFAEKDHCCLLSKLELHTRSRRFYLTALRALLKMRRRHFLFKWSWLGLLLPPWCLEPISILGAAPRPPTGKAPSLPLSLPWTGLFGRWLCRGWGLPAQEQAGLDQNRDPCHQEVAQWCGLWGLAVL